MIEIRKDYMQRTLIILKPDCMEKNLAGSVLARFAEAGFQIAACKMMILSKDLLKSHYAHLVNMHFFPDIEKFMGSRPVMVIILEAENAIAKMRELLGPTDSTIAPKGTIRGDFGSTKMENIAHASDSPEAAEAEIKCFFKPDEVFGSLSQSMLK